MYLFNLQNFAQRFGIDMTVSDFNDAVTEAAKASTRVIASQFRFQDFDLFSARRDVFHVPRMFEAGNAQNRRFRLARGFIDGANNFTAYYTDNPVHVRNGDTDQLTNLQRTNNDNKSDYLFIDAETGLLTTYSLDLTDMWIIVTYDCGLTVAADAEFEGVPSWLAEAAELQTLIYLKQNRALSDEDGGDTVSSLRSALAQLQAAHMRFHPEAVLPTMSEPGK